MKQGVKLKNKKFNVTATVKETKEGTIRAVADENDKVIYLIKEDVWSDKWIKL